MRRHRPTKPLSHLWRAIDSVPGLRAVEAEWIHRLSTELEPLRPYLLLTNELATCYPALDQGEPRPIVAHASDDYAAICPEGGVALALRRADVAVYRFDVARLARAIGSALGVSGNFSPVPYVGVVWRIGTLPLDLGARPAFMAIPADAPALATQIDAIASQCRQPYVLFAPTRRWLDARGESRLTATDGVFVPVCDLLQLRHDGQLLVAAAAKAAIVAALGMAAAGGRIGNTFKLQGDMWVVSFEGTTVYLSNSVGMAYIARLLAEPGRELPAVSLLAARAGIDPRIASGSSGEVLTDETRENYRRRYQDLQDDMEEAKEDNDLGRIAKLELEMEALTNELASATGLGGRSREKSDIDKVRKSVSMAVARDVERIGKQHEALGRHLLAAIGSGRTFRYAPELETEWLT
jgi:hypothetical protein